MSTYTTILYQIVFGSKNYTMFLNHENQNLLFNYIRGVIEKRNNSSYKVGGYGNHIHIIMNLHPKNSLSDLIRDIKMASGFMMKEKKDLFPNFPGWQVGFGAFTYHIDSKLNLINYVDRQEKHHRMVEFKDELKRLLDEFGLEYKDTYLLI
jgi:REP-associated tyrosine transposase